MSSDEEDWGFRRFRRSQGYWKVMYRICQLVVLVIVRVLLTRDVKKSVHQYQVYVSLRTLLNKPDSFLDALDASESAAAFLRVST